MTYWFIGSPINEIKVFENVANEVRNFFSVELIDLEVFTDNLDCIFTRRASPIK